MHRNTKSNFRTNNAITYNVIANKIIKEHTIIDGDKFSKKVHNKIYFKTPEKKYKNYNDYDEDVYDEDVYDEDY